MKRLPCVSATEVSQDKRPVLMNAKTGMSTAISAYFWAMLRWIGVHLGH
jgi:hypothetical protein